MNKKITPRLLYAIEIGYSLVVAMESLRRQILSRLRRGHADERALAGWCEIHVRGLRRVLSRLRSDGEIRLLADGRYALPINPLSPAGPIVIPQFRWHSTRLA